jgi:hypothetical protein
MRSVLRFAIGLGAALVFAAAVLSAVVLAFTLAIEGVASRGDVGEWGDRLRHYTDTVVANPDGSWRVDEASSPLLQMAGALTLAILLAAASAWLVRASTSSEHVGRAKR